MLFCHSFTQLAWCSPLQIHWVCSLQHVSSHLRAVSKNQSRRVTSPAWSHQPGLFPLHVAMVASTKSFPPAVTATASARLPSQPLGLMRGVPPSLWDPSLAGLSSWPFLFSGPSTLSTLLYIFHKPSTSISACAVLTEHLAAPPFPRGRFTGWNTSPSGLALFLKVPKCSLINQKQIGLEYVLLKMHCCL